MYIARLFDVLDVILTWYVLVGLVITEPILISGGDGKLGKIK